MIFTKTKIKDVKIIEPNIFEDSRGKFVKFFNEEIFKSEKINFSLKENYYSISKKGVIRGMHFQVPPLEHSKIVYVIKGKILDVVLDIRNGSPTFGQYITIELSDENCKSVYVPAGCAHGFQCLKNGSVVVYLQTSLYSKPHDAGIRFDSFGFKWQIKDPIISERDSGFPTLDQFISPFKYEAFS